MLQNYYVTGREKILAYRAAAIVLNSLHPAEVWGVNARTFEVAAAGGFQIVDARPGLGQLFDEGSEIVSFSDVKDLKNKIDYYLREPELRQDLAEAGRKRARQDHTYRMRVEMMLKTIGCAGQGYPLPDISVSPG
jgi:spore maturation protein CgeB